MALFRQINEMGSLTPLEAQSVYPTLLIGHVWEDRRARRLVIVSFLIGLVLLAVDAIAVTRLDVIPWIGAEATAPAERLLLLPVLDGLIWLGNLVMGALLFPPRWGYAASGLHPLGHFRCHRSALADKQFIIHFLILFEAHGYKITDRIGCRGGDRCPGLSRAVT